MTEESQRFYHDADYRREILYNSIEKLLKEHSMTRLELISVLRNEFGFTKMSASQFSKMFSPRSSQKQNPDLAVVLAMAEYFDVPVGVMFEGGTKRSMDKFDYNYNEIADIAVNFFDWLVDWEYCSNEDRETDIPEMIEDFENAYKVAPRLINLLRDISDR